MNEFPYTSLVSQLTNQGLLNQETLLQLLSEAKTQGCSFVSYLVKNKVLTSDTIAKVCEASFGLPVFDLTQYEKAWLTNSPLNVELISRYRAVPLNREKQILHIGLSDPSDQHIIHTLAFQTGLEIRAVIVKEDQLTQFIETYCNENQVSKMAQLNLLKQIALEDQSYLIQENTVNYNEPVVKFVDSIISHALQQKASDIHIETYATTCRIRYRQHGVLYEITEIPHTLASRIITRLKVMAKLDISERRLPQDGRFQFQEIDIRINTCPTLYGEKTVLRLLNSNKISLDVETLGFSANQKNLFLEKISQPQGMVLVTGPTGSGKTVTLYSALNFLNHSEKNISTVEDPIEIQLRGINQVNVNAKIAFNFSTALRTFLRQDPDIIMVGEIRDKETAEIAIQAAQTGHLVLSTLHTNSAVETITRLRSMEILPYNIICSLTLIIAQRLIRQLCSQCKTIDEINQALFSQPIYRAQGCQYCSHGYTQRIAIYEFLPFTEKIIQMIIAGSDSQTLLNQAITEGFIPLKKTGLEKVMQGITSFSEINRVLQT